MNRRNERHGMAGSRIYRIWAGILTRCLNPDSTMYYLYGAMGVTVAPEWQRSFLAFYRDVGDAPSTAHSIDRIDSSRGYFPGNVRWATPRQQSRNSARNTMINFGGKLVCLAEAQDITGIPWSTIRGRLRRGWTEELAATVPPHRTRTATPAATG